MKVFLLLFLSLSAALAQQPPTPLSVQTDRPTAVYAVGETVSFSIALKTSATAEVTWSLSKDGVDPKTSGKLALKDGKAVITGKLDEPGFLLCRVTSMGADKKPISAMAGAAVDPLKIRAEPAGACGF